MKSTKSNNGFFSWMKDSKREEGVCIPRKGVSSANHAYEHQIYKGKKEGHGSTFHASSYWHLQGKL